MKNKLPPLTSLKVFYFVARHQNLSKAAKELGVTQGAISRQIYNLEEWVGDALFKRLARGVELTAVGLSLIYSVQKAFDILETAFEPYQEKEKSNDTSGGEVPTRVTTLPSFAAHWFFPNLDEFLIKHPGTFVQISTSQNLVDFEKEEFDFGIRFGRGKWPGLEVEAIFSKTQVPVCSPNLLPKNKTLNLKVFLESTPLIFSGAFGHWENLISRLGVEKLESPKKINLDDMNIAIQAAIDGQGVALLPEVLVRSGLRKGVLINPLNSSLETDLGYYVVYLKNKNLCKASVSLIKWLQKS